MSRMKDLNTRLDGLEVWQDLHSQTFAAVIAKLDALLHLMKDMVLLEGKIETLEETVLERLTRMEASQVDSGKLVDRLIEMTLVKQGQGADAAVHRAQSRLENDFSSRESWAADETPEDVWPPPNSDVAYI